MSSDNSDKKSIKVVFFILKIRSTYLSKRFLVIWLLGPDQIYTKHQVKLSDKFPVN